MKDHSIALYQQNPRRHRLLINETDKAPRPLTPTKKIIIYLRRLKLVSLRIPHSTAEYIEFGSQSVTGEDYKCGLVLKPEI